LTVGCPKKQTVGSKEASMVDILHDFPVAAPPQQVFAGG
jgi:hypothetical protein